VWQTSLRLLGNEADAADCFQNTFLAAMQGERGGEVRNWAGFLQRIATTRAIDMLRRRRAGRLTEGAMATEAVASRELGPSEELQNAELGERLAEALTQLPRRQAEAYCLRHLNEMSYQEIAEALGVSVDAVGVDLHRAQGRLRELLSGVCAQARERGDS